MQIQKSLLISAHFFCLQIVSVTSNAQNLKSSERGWKIAIKAEMMKMQPLFWSVLKDTACPSPLSVKRRVKNSKSRLFVTLYCSEVLIPRVSHDTPKALPQSGAARVPVFGIRSPQLREPQQPVSESLSQAGRWWVEPRKDAVLPPDCRPVYPVFCGPYTLSAWEVHLL